jgi:CSLREA domain-containing protein
MTNQRWRRALLSRIQHDPAQLLRRLLLTLLLGLFLGLSHAPRPAYAATITVTTDTDVVANNGQCSLREALINANNDNQSGSTDCLAGTGADTIAFNIVGAGVRTINVPTALPDITAPLTIDGWTQGGVGYTGPPLIELNGSGTGAGVNGLTFRAGGNLVRGLIVNRFGENGIAFPDNVVDTLFSDVQGNYIGTNAGGTAAAPNGAAGIYVGSTAVIIQIGGTDASERNVISGNTQQGIRLETDNPLNRSVVLGNFIGTNAAGTAALGNGAQGIAIYTSAGHIIGGNVAGTRNVISGNGQQGIEVRFFDGTGAATTIEGNYIGTDVTGELDLGNASNGILIAQDAQNVRVAENLISGNNQNGIRIDSASTNIIQRNTIGLSASGADLGNTQAGVSVDGVSGLAASNNVIGGTGAAARNIIAGNDARGVYINAQNATNTVIQSNYIGTDATGLLDRGNGNAGVWIAGGADGTVLGGASADEGNVIAGNDTGVLIADNGTDDTVVLGNLIGLGADGTTDLGNDGDGVVLASNVNDATIGGTSADTRNIISGNGEDGVLIFGVGLNNRVLGNYIGTNAAGTAAVANGSDGIEILQTNIANPSTIGGDTAAERNVISGNTQYGIRIDDSSNFFVQGNYVGLNAAGTASVANGIDGVFLTNGASNNQIGGATAGERNILSGNGDDGLEFDGAGSGNRVIGNYAGTNPAGTAAIPNAQTGMQIIDSPGTIVGGTLAGEANLLSGNLDRGLILTGDNVTAQGNLIGVDASGNAALGNGTQGIFLAGSNNLIGGTLAGARNVIAANGSGVLADQPQEQVGIFVLSGGRTTDANAIQGNYVGLGADGDTDLGNDGDGILISDAATNTTVGSSDSAGRNVISGNGAAGIRVGGSSAAGAGTVIVGNQIGVAANGTTARGNGIEGISVDNGSDEVTIGGTGVGQANIIANNASLGVFVADGSDGVAVRGNSIYDNGDLGIDLAPIGLTANDPDDADLGANFGQNFPSISQAIINGSNQLIVDFTLDSLITNSAYPVNVDFYAADGGEGSRYLGSQELSGPGEGVANLGAASELAIVDGDSIVATATDANSNSSEFSAAFIVGGSGATQDGPIFTVNSVADPGDGDCSVDDCSLREAIAAANALPNAGEPDEIRFAIGTGQQTIVVASGLPAIVEAVLIDGTTQPGFAGTPLIELDGSALPGFPAPIASGLVIASGGSTVQGLVINNFTENGILISGAAADGNVIRGNYIGTDSSGNAAAQNALHGVALLNGADDNIVGGTTAAARNVLSGNNGSGVTLDGDAIAVTGNAIVGNYIGINAAGTAGVGNFLGVSTINTVSGNIIGGDTAAERNVIGGNNTGVSLLEGSSVVQGNYIGLGPNGSSVLGNSNLGMLVASAGNTIGGTTAGARNVISGNGSGIMFSSGGNNNTVQGNYIGTDVTGQLARGNGEGIFYNFAGANNLIGGTTVGARNVISGNAADGIRQDLSDGGDTIQGNYIGVAADGTTPLGNGSDGVILGSPNVTLGGTATGAGNLIANNGGAGVVVFNNDGVIRANRIFDNTGLAIDLDGDGVTLNDADDGDTGPNGLQNFPVIARAVPVPGATTIQGRLNSTPGTSFDLDFYNVASCDASGYGEAATYLGSTTAATDNGGDAIFSFSAPTTPANSFVAATATGPDGTSELSLCAPVDFANDSWTRALDITLAGDPSAPTGFQQQFIAVPGQARWYRIQVPPDSRIIAELSNLPANYDLAIYSDIAQAYDALADITDLALIDTEFEAGGVGEQDLAPNALSPETLSPEAFSEEAFDPVEFDNSVIDALAVAPLKRSPLKRSPLKRSPIPPQEYQADIYALDSFDPDDPPVDPDRFVGAQSRSLVAASTNDGAAAELVVANSWSNGGFFYIRVDGRNGASSLATPFRLDVQLLTGACGPVDLPTAALPVASSGPYTTVILTDLSRIPGTSAQTTTLLGRLNAFRARREVGGVLVNLGDATAYPRVAQARAEAIANPACPFAMNLFAGEVKRIVDAYRAANPGLRYIVIVGDDAIVPFFRYPDAAGLGNESDYVPPVFDNSTSQANLRLGYFLGQDNYGARFQIGPNRLPVPDLPVGRLVETAAEATIMLDAYIAANGVAPAPNSALVTGYDFLADAAQAISVELSLGLGTPVSGLIADPTKSPNDPSMWNATQFQNLVLQNTGGDGFDLMYLAGHFDGNGALAADNRTVMQARTLAESTTNLTNAIVFSNGCHAGYNLVDAHTVVSVTDSLDWGQAFARKGAVLIAGSGYQFGDTELLEYGERLYLNFARELRVGSGPIPVGAALVAAKQRYLADTPLPYEAHDKTVQTVTLYGLPMLSVNLPAGRFTPPADPTQVPTTAPFTSVAGDPGDALGLRFADLSITPTLTLSTTPLSNLNPPPSTLTASFYRGPDGVAANPAEPILPLDRVNVTRPGLALRGVGFRSGSYTDAENILPLISAAATEIRGVQVGYRSETFFPGRVWSVNYFEALAREGGATRLMFTPAQFRTPDPTQLTGVLRRYDDAQFRLFYSGNLESYGPGGANVPALADPPAIVRVESSVDGDQVTFRAFVTGDPAAGIQSVWVTYTGDGGTLVGEWRALDLVQDAQQSTLWTATLDLSDFGDVEAGNLNFMVQAVNGVGLVTLDDNEGFYYQVGIDPATLPSFEQAQTGLAFQSPAASGVYGTQASFTALLTDTDGPLAGRTLIFSLGGQSIQAQTGADGRASVTLALLALPASYDLSVAFLGSADEAPSAAVVPFAIQRQATTLSLEPASATISIGAPPPLVATLSDASGRPLKEQTVIFVLAGSASTRYEAIVTDQSGRASLASELPSGLPEGSYSVQAFFGSSPIPGVTIDSARYAPSDDTAALTVQGQPARVSPVLECVVDRGPSASPRYLARFGYSNPNSFTVNIPVGSDNRFTPTPQDRGQPTSYAPGRQRAVFEVGFDNQALVWRLDGRTSTASRGSRRCS